MRPTLWLAALLVGATACEDVSSQDLFTSGMSAQIHGTADGSGTTQVVALLKAGGTLSNTFVDLEGDDELNVTVNEQTTRLTKRSLGVIHDYMANVQYEEPGETFTVSFTRSLDDGAPNSTFALPDPFIMGTVDENFNPSMDLSVTWSPPDDGQMEVLVTGECIQPWSEQLSGDPGSVVIPGSEIETLEGEPGASCPLDIVVRRVLGGQLDSGFGEGGYAQGRQERTAETMWSSGS